MHCDIESHLYTHTALYPQNTEKEVHKNTSPKLQTVVWRERKLSQICLEGSKNSPMFYQSKEKF